MRRSLLALSLIVAAGGCFNGSLTWQGSGNGNGAGGSGGSGGGGGTGSTVTVTSITPNSGPWRGSVPVTIAGEGFSSGATVTVGGSTCINPIVMNAQQVLCTTTRHVVTGLADVVVTNADSGSGTLDDGYRTTYHAILGEAAQLLSYEVGSDGVLTFTSALPQPVNSLAMNGPGTFVYALAAPIKLRHFAISAAGALTESTYGASSGNPPDLSAFFGGMFVNLAGNILYQFASDTDNQIISNGLSISGELSSTGPAVSCASCTDAILSADGNFVYGVNSGTQSVHRYDVNQTTGGLSDPNIFRNFGADTPHRLAVDPQGRYVYVAMSGSPDIKSLPLDLSSEVSLGMGSNAIKHFAAHPNGDFLYVGIRGTDTINIVQIQGGGAMQLLTTAQATDCNPIRGLALVPSGFLYAVGAGGSTVCGFQIASGGSTLNNLVSQSIGTSIDHIAIR